MPRTIIIGDVHGCALELADLLNKVKLRGDDKLVFIGDLINRGPDTAGVFRIVHNLQYQKKFILGNHELRLLNYRKKKKGSILKAYDKPTVKILTPKDWELMENMVPYVYKKKHDTLIIHGGLLPKIPWKNQSIKDITRIQVSDKKGKGHKRSECWKGTPWAKLWAGPPFVIYGHTPYKQVHHDLWAMGIDTGCVYGGYLTAYILPEKEIIQIPARKTYHINKGLL